MQKNVCKICRRMGEKLFLKGDKCFSQKCPLLRKPYPPGKSPQWRRSQERLSEYGKELREAQKLKKIYDLRDKQFKKIIKEVLKKGKQENVSELLIKRIEKTLSNVVFRAGLAKSRRQAKQLVSHGHFLLNGKRVDIPSIQTKVGDEIKIREGSLKKAYFRNILSLLKEEEIPSWLSFDKKTHTLKVVREPKLEEIGVKIDIPLIISFYSR